MRDRILRFKEVLETVRVSKSSIYRRIAAGQFPAQIRLGGPGSRAVGWRESEILKWLDELG